MIKIIKKINYYLDFTCPIPDKNLQKIAIYGGVVFFLFIVIFKPYIFSELSTQSLIKSSVIVSFLSALSAWIFYYLVPQNIGGKTWTYRKDIILFFKMVVFAIIIFIIYLYIGVKYLYKDEITTTLDYMLFVRSVGYMLFMGIVSYIVLRFVDHLILFFNDLSLDSEINKKNSDSKIKYTKREKEILDLISEGKTSAQIAEELFISIATVNTHRQNLIKKNKVKNTSALLKLLKE